MNIVLLIPVALAWLGGLLVNYLSDTLPRTRRFSPPVCHNCESRIAWLDYLTLRRCQNCGIVRSLRTWLTQFILIASFLYVWLNPPKSLGLPLGLIVLLYFAVITVIDLEHRLILFPTSVFGALLGLFSGTFLYYSGFQKPLLSAIGISLLGGLIGFAVMFALYQVGTIVARYRAKKMATDGLVDDEEEALGGGDVYLAGVLGLMLGSRFIMYGLVVGILIGGVVSLALLLALIVQKRYTNNSLMTFIPYGPYLIAGAAYMLFRP